MTNAVDPDIKVGEVETKWVWNSKEDVVLLGSVRCCGSDEVDVRKHVAVDLEREIRHAWVRVVDADMHGIICGALDSHNLHSALGIVPNVVVARVRAARGPGVKRGSAHVNVHLDDHGVGKVGVAGADDFKGARGPVVPGLASAESGHYIHPHGHSRGLETGRGSHLVHNAVEVPERPEPVDVRRRRPRGHRSKLIVVDSLPNTDRKNVNAVLMQQPGLLLRLEALGRLTIGEDDQDAANASGERPHAAGFVEKACPHCPQPRRCESRTGWISDVLDGL